jgi:lysyl-tRNA synthetase class 2
MLEFYQAYANYHDLMDLTEDLIKTVAIEVNGTTITNFNGIEIDLGKWTKLSMREVIIKFWTERGWGPAPKSISFANSLLWEEELQRATLKVTEWLSTAIDLSGEIFRRTGVLPLETERYEADQKFLNAAVADLLTGTDVGKSIANVFEFLAEPHLIQPTIIYDFPLAVSPLSKVKPDEPDWVERFEFYIGGFEVGNAFSELNDPDDQRARFLAQVADKDPESMAEVDEDYVRALGIGLPPTAGEGIGIDRLTMILTGSKSIRDVILFPLMRPHTKTPASEINEEGNHGESAE